MTLFKRMIFAIALLVGFCATVSAQNYTPPKESLLVAAVTRASDPWGEREQNFSPAGRVQLSQSQGCAKRNNACSGTCPEKKSCKSSDLHTSGSCSCQ
ncbi:hypothetical protein [Bradyrhizobium stylosanthis]|uniref:Secreted protein n=1 Tax=Bradyrhizobium stylosanthis TaxID=1803665 RepID=A0A560DIP6_9BRAD|nr:hypothetical protein [Bradyrhizobium stylosanthis]TWA96956.1 hypothetical protein FBZ96_1067 [Bradyrhizobium stylosanthis]